MHFTRPFIFAFLSLVASVHAAPGPSSSLTKRWCGFEISCHCRRNYKAGCVPKFDKCGQQWFWPPECTHCGHCSQLCVDFFRCVDTS